MSLGGDRVDVLCQFLPIPANRMVFFVCGNVITQFGFNLYFGLAKLTPFATRGYQTSVPGR